MRLESFEYIVSIFRDIYGEDRDKMDLLFERLNGLTLKFSLLQYKRELAQEMLLNGESVVNIAKQLDMKKVTVYKIKQRLFDLNI